MPPLKEHGQQGCDSGVTGEAQGSLGLEVRMEHVWSSRASPRMLPRLVVCTADFHDRHTDKAGGWLRAWGDGVDTSSGSHRARGRHGHGPIPRAHHYLRRQSVGVLATRLEERSRVGPPWRAWCVGLTRQESPGRSLSAGTAWAPPPHSPAREERRVAPGQHGLAAGQGLRGAGGQQQVGGHGG